MPGDSQKQALRDNGEKSNHTCATAPTPTPPANLTGRQRHPSAVSNSVLAGERGKSMLLGLEINLDL